jgi:hypothetical protein
MVCKLWTLENVRIGNGNGKGKNLAITRCNSQRVGMRGINTTTAKKWTYNWKFYSFLTNRNNDLVSCAGERWREDPEMPSKQRMNHTCGQRRNCYVMCN